MLCPKASVNGALTTHTGLNNVFDNAMFPVRTLYSPPVPPSTLMARYRPPPRPPRKYLNDILLAGPVEHWAQTQVSRMWRGVLTRRRLRNELNFAHVRRRRATMIQCWWRCLRAIWRRRALEKIMKEWAVSRRESMVAERLKAYGIMMTWQCKRFENAVVKVQQVYRWHRSRRQDIFLVAKESPKEGLPFPLEARKKIYFPWRHRDTTTEEQKLRSANGRSELGEEEHCVSSLQFRKNRKVPVPPSIDEAKAINDAMRQREAQYERALAQPEVQDRLKWKRDGLQENDFDHNAGMIQRMVKYKHDGLKVMTRKVTADYFNGKVRLIQRAFRIYQTLRKMRRRRIGIDNRSALKNDSFAKAKIDCILEEMVWKSVLLHNAAQTIKMTWANYKHRRARASPFFGMEDAEEQKSESPPPPPYHLIDEHIAREHVLRDVARSRMEKEMEEAASAVGRRHIRYKPSAVEVFIEEGVYLPAKGSQG